MDKDNFGKADRFSGGRVCFTQGVGFPLLLSLIHLPHLLRPLYRGYAQLCYDLCTFSLRKSSGISADQVVVLWESTGNSTQQENG